MKKLISLILIVCMACMMIPAMAEGESGTWYLVEMVTNGVTINPAEMGMNWSLTLNEDGTADNRMEMMGEVQEKSGTWTQEGDTVTVTIDDSPVAFQLADGKLTADMDGQTAVFSQEAPEASAKPAVVAAESEEAFFGDSYESQSLLGYFANRIGSGSIAGVTLMDCPHIDTYYIADLQDAIVIRNTVNNLFIDRHTYISGESSIILEGWYHPVLHDV